MPLIANPRLCMIKAEKRLKEEMEDRLMNIVIAVALLILLILHIGKKNKPAQKKPERDNLAWIDELEILDAIMDDFA